MEAVEACLQSPRSYLSCLLGNCEGQVTWSPFSYGQTTRKMCYMGKVLLLCLNQPARCSSECTSEWKPLWASITKRGKSTRPPKAELSLGWHSVITEHWWKRGELIEWVSNLVARVTLSWLEGRDHRVQHRLCWIGKWCLIFVPCLCLWAEKGRVKIESKYCSICA